MSMIMPALFGILFLLTTLGVMTAQWLSRWPICRMFVSRRMLMAMLRGYWPHVLIVGMLTIWNIVPLCLIGILASVVDIHMPVHLCDAVLRRAAQHYMDPNSTRGDPLQRAAAEHRDPPPTCTPGVEGRPPGVEGRPPGVEGRPPGATVTTPSNRRQRTMAPPDL